MRDRAQHRDEQREADRARLQPLAREEVVRVRQLRIGQFARDLLGLDSPSEPVALPHAVADLVEQLVPEADARIGLDRRLDRRVAADSRTPPFPWRHRRTRSARTTRSAATGASQRHGERMNVCGQRTAEAIAAVANTAASAIQTIRLSVSRAVATMSTSRSAPSASASRRRARPTGAGAISVSSNGAVSTT